MIYLPHRYVHCRVNSDTLLLLVAIAQMAAIQISMNRFHTEAREGRERILVQVTKNELALANHIAASTKRWHYLHKVNPDIVTPDPTDDPLEQ